MSILNVNYGDVNGNYQSLYTFPFFYTSYFHTYQGDGTTTYRRSLATLLPNSEEMKILYFVIPDDSSSDSMNRELINFGTFPIYSEFISSEGGLGAEFTMFMEGEYSIIAVADRSGWTIQLKRSTFEYAGTRKSFELILMLIG